MCVRVCVFVMCVCVCDCVCVCVCLCVCVYMCVRACVYNSRFGIVQNSIIYIGGLAHSWIRYFCQFSKSEDVQFLRLIPLGQHNKVFSTIFTQ